MLPLWKRVVFVDWHGVLSHAPFWHSILRQRRHELNAPARQIVNELFVLRGELRDAWMRGALTSRKVLDQIDLDSLGCKGCGEILLQTLYRDCLHMNYDTALMVELQKWRQNGFLVLATDNVDLFVEATKARPSLSAKLDGILCSSELGTLKSDSPERFFGGWLAAHGLSFADAALIDDRRDNCARFRAAGGEAVEFRSAADFPKRIGLDERMR
jgi:FMN phosphatase YigB (HAD superfamily)